MRLNGNGVIKIIFYLYGSKNKASELMDCLYAILNGAIKIALIGLVLLPGSIANADSRQRAIEVTQAGLVYSDHLTPPDMQKADPVLLPHHWNIHGLYGSAWYIFTFSPDSVTLNEVWAIYIPDVIMNAQVWLNGVLIGSGGQLTPPIARQWHSPLMFSVPTALIQTDNTVHIRVVAYTNRHAKLGSVYIGPETELQSRFTADYFTSVTLSIISGVVTFLLAGLLFSIWLKRRESEYFWFALANLMWCVYNVNIFVHNLPVKEQFWEKIVFLSSGWLAIAIAFSMIRLDKKHYPYIEKYLLASCGIWNIIIVFSSEEQMFVLFPYWLQFCFVAACAGIAHLAWQWTKNRKKQNAIILFLIFFIAIAGLHDVAIQSYWIDLGTGLWLDYSLPLFFLIMSYLLVSRFLQALDETECLNMELEERIHHAGKLLEKNYQKILAMEKLQAITQERQRIHRDLHDSIGAKLLSLVYQSATDEHETLARSALADLRGVVQHPPKSINDLSDVVYKWKAECFKRCNEVDISLIFHVYHVPADMLFTTEVTQSIYLILTEALSNAIKHHSSHTITIVVRYRLNYLKFTVKDQSDYSKLKQWQQGVGMHNMQFRVKALNGKIKWQGTHTGGQVSWIFPYTP